MSAARGLLRAVSAYRDQVVGTFYDMGARAVAAGRQGTPFAFLVPPDQFDPSAAAKLEELLIQGGVEIHRAVEPFRAGNRDYPAGTDLILAAQPYRAYVKTLLERQIYPRRPPAPDAGAAGPYDVTGWTLPAQMGVDVRPIDRPFVVPVGSPLSAATVPAGSIRGDRRPSYYVVDTSGNAGALAINRLLAAGVSIASTSATLDTEGATYPAGSLVIANSRQAQAAIADVVAKLGLRATGTRRKPAVAAAAIGAARLAVYAPWTDNADEGWTRWILDRFEFRYQAVTDADVRAGSLRSRFDVVILPSAPSDQLVSGNRPGSAPPEYVGGLGEAGVAALAAFVQSGGTLVCLDQACGLAVARFGLPLRDVAHEASSDDFYCPGSIVRLDLDPHAPLAQGMPAHSAGFFAFSAAYDVLDESRVNVIARYAERDLLVSGWLDGEAVVAGKAAAVEVSVGAGRVIVLGFPVQHRGQSLATFRLLLNALVIRQ